MQVGWFTNAVGFRAAASLANEPIDWSETYWLPEHTKPCLDFSWDLFACSCHVFIRESRLEISGLQSAFLSRWASDPSCIFSSCASTSWLASCTCMHRFAYLCACTKPARQGLEIASGLDASELTSACHCHICQGGRFFRQVRNCAAMGYGHTRCAKPDNRALGLCHVYEH